MDLIVIVVLIALVIIFFRRFESFIYALGIIDIFLRLVNFIKIELFTGKIYNFLNKVPASIPDVLDNYASGLLYKVLLWIYIAGMVIFEFYLIVNFFRRR